MLREVGITREDVEEVEVYVGRGRRSFDEVKKWGEFGGFWRW
jgi:hypothetical protein